jgi:cobalt/nickel transport system permease protein
MHIPDGFLTPEIWMPMWAVSGAIVAVALNRTKGKIGDKQAPMMGVLAAFIFAGQMLNIPAAAGTSAHMLGGVLAAVMLGPWTASIIMACVFIVQGLLFQDGGITAMGANMFNMGFAGTIGGYFLWTLLVRLFGERYRVLFAGMAGWTAIVVASALTAMEIGLSGTAPLAVVVATMVGIHAVAGLIEAALTMGVLAYIGRVRPDLLQLRRI